MGKNSDGSRQNGQRRDCPPRDISRMLAKIQKIAHVQKVTLGNLKSKGTGGSQICIISKNDTSIQLSLKTSTQIQQMTLTIDAGRGASVITELKKLGQVSDKN